MRTLAQLLQEYYRTGSRCDLNEFFVLVYQTAWTACRFLGKGWSYDALEEAVQRVVFCVWEKVEDRTLDPKRSIVGFIWKLAGWREGDMLREAANSPTLRDEELLTIVHDGNSDELANEERMRRIRDYLRTHYTVVECMALILSLNKGYTYQTIVDMLRLPSADYTGRLLRRMLKDLHDQFGQGIDK